MFEILFASSSFILRLATLVKSAEVWVKDSFISETWFDVLWYNETVEINFWYNETVEINFWLIYKFSILFRPRANCVGV